MVFLNGDYVECPIMAVNPGDRVLIRPGSRIPVDGKVVAGISTVEEAAITGEPLFHRRNQKAVPFTPEL